MTPERRCVMRYTPQDQVTALSFFCQTLDGWKNYGLHDANLVHLARHILMAHAEGKGINILSLAECTGSPYETVRGRVNRLLEIDLFCRTDNGLITLCEDQKSQKKWEEASQRVIENLLAVAADINRRHSDTEIR